MTIWNLSADTPASDMDGGGTDLASKDTVNTGAWKLDLDIDCGFHDINISAGGTLEIGPHTYTIDDLFERPGIDAFAGSSITGPNLTKAMPAVFQSQAGKKVPPIHPYYFRTLGTIVLDNCYMCGSKYNLKNANYELEFPFGSARVLVPSYGIGKYNQIQGAQSIYKTLGSRPRLYTIKGVLFDLHMNLEELIHEMIESMESFSFITERYQLESVKIINFVPSRQFPELMEYQMVVVQEV